MTTRRGFIGTLMAASLVPKFSWADAGNPGFLGAARRADGQFSLFGISRAGADVFEIPLPGRGHAAAAHPTRPEAVAFARRPGTYALVIDCVAGRVRQQLQAPAGRHFYGHGVFLADGSVLCTSENDIQTGQGRIGLWSVGESYRRMGEIASGGIGPHDMKLLSDGMTLVVANGGIHTHPDHGREKLNIDTMRPNLSYLTVADGVVDQVQLSPTMAKASIRHLALAKDDLVGFAMQWQGDEGGAASLLGTHRRGAQPGLIQAGDHLWSSMDGYVGSIAFDASGQQICVTSPRGGRALTFDRGGALIQTTNRADVCGVAHMPQAGFLLSDGFGNLLGIGDQTRVLARHKSRSWDNHLVVIGA